MKSYRMELPIHTKTRRAYINITPQVEAVLAERGVHEGLCLVNAMNITASVFINDNESGLHRDFDKWLERLAPEKPYDQYATMFTRTTRTRTCKIIAENIIAIYK